MRCPPDGQLFASTNRAAGTCVRWHLERVSEVAADFSFAGVPGPELPATFLRIHDTDRHCTGIVYEPAVGILRAYVSDSGDPDARRPFTEASVPARTPDGGPFRLRLRVAGGTLSAWFEGQPAFENLPVPGFPARIDAQPAFGADTAAPGIVLVIEHLRFRRLPEEDDGPELALPGFRTEEDEAP